MAVKIASLAFVILLVTAHIASAIPEVLEYPLSMLRDGDESTIGYTLFGLLAVITVFMTAASVRDGRQVEIAVFCVASLLLIVVALTPSMNPFHILCSLMLIALVYSYFGILLHAASSGWRYVHWPAALLLWFATGCYSYGLWQKSLIVYFVFLVNLHQHLVSRPVPAPVRKAHARRTGRPGKRRVVYVVPPGKSWRRRRQTLGSSST